MNTIHYQIVNYIYTKLTKQPLKYYYSEKHLLNDYIKDKFYYINSTIEYSKKAKMI